MEHRNEKPTPSSRQRGLLAAPRNLEPAQARWGLFRSALWRSRQPTGTAPQSRRWQHPLGLFALTAVRALAAAPATAPRPRRCSRGGTPASKGLHGRRSQQRTPPTNEARARDSAPMPSPWRSTLTSQTKSAASLPEHARHELRGWHRLHRQRVPGFHEKTGLSRRAARRTSQSGSISPCSDVPLMPASLADVK
jgi:hypothetical protein